MKGIPPETHLASLISPSMMGITDVVTCFSLRACASACLNLLKSRSENFDGDSECRGLRSVDRATSDQPGAVRMHGHMVLCSWSW